MNEVESWCRLQGSGLAFVIVTKDARPFVQPCEPSREEEAVGSVGFSLGCASSHCLPALTSKKWVKSKKKKIKARHDMARANHRNKGPRTCHKGEGNG